MSPCWNDCTTVPLSGPGTILTSPPPFVSVARPFCFNQERSATSWVLPSDGDPTFLPLRSAAVLISGFTTRNAPPEAVPATMRMAAPFDLLYALMAGFGPTNEASMLLEKSASTAFGPALNTLVFSVTLAPSALANSPSWSPIIAGAWVTFPK